MKSLVSEIHKRILYLSSMAILRKSYLEIPKTKKMLIKSQTKSWKRVRQNLLGTEIDSTFNLKSLPQYEDLLNLDSHDYSFFSPFIDKMIDGEKSVMSKQEPFHYLLTSGSSGKHAKKIPYNEQMFINLQDAQKKFGATLFRETGINPVFSDTINYGSKYKCYEKNGFVFGYASGLLKSRMSSIYAKINLPSSEIINIDDWDTKIRKMYEETCQRDVQIMTGVPLYLIKIFEDILKLTKKNKISEIWPNIKAIGYGGTSIDRYKDKLNELVGHELSFFGLYVASESPIGVAKGGHNGTQFYNFLPQVVYTFSRELGDGKLLGVSELKDREEYFIHITGDHGLVNYQMKDRIKVYLDVDDQLYFEVLGRNEDGLNLATEKIPSDVIDECLKKTQEEMNFKIDHYLVSPFDRDGSSGYHWTFFTSSLHTSISESDLLHVFEKYMCLLREDYRSCRYDEELLIAPKFTLLDTKLLDNYFRLNREKGQFKMKNLFKTEAEYKLFLKENF